MVIEKDESVSHEPVLELVRQFRQRPDHLRGHGGQRNRVRVRTVHADGRTDRILVQDRRPEVPAVRSTEHAFERSPYPDLDGGLKDIARFRARPCLRDPGAQLMQGHVNLFWCRLRWKRSDTVFDLLVEHDVLLNALLKLRNCRVAFAVLGRARARHRGHRRSRHDYRGQNRDDLRSRPALPRSTAALVSMMVGHTDLHDRDYRRPHGTT
jgi:hypothetical protein